MFIIAGTRPEVKNATASFVLHGVAPVEVPALDSRTMGVGVITGYPGDCTEETAAGNGETKVGCVQYELPADATVAGVCVMPVCVNTCGLSGGIGAGAFGSEVDCRLVELDEICMELLA